MKLDPKKLQFLMAVKCMEVKKLSKISGLHECTISKIKIGSQNAKPVTIGKIAKALEVDVTELIEQEN